MSDTDPYMAPDAPKTEEAVYKTEETVEAPKVEAPTATVPQNVPVQPVEAVPEGSIKEVLAWVGTDAKKAQKALEAENNGDKRSSLISKLEALTK